MALWFVLGLMMLVATFAVLWPLSRAPSRRVTGQEAAIYRDQLAEVDRDLANEVIGATEADAARVEVSRRLLAASRLDEVPPPLASTSLRRGVATIALVVLPLLSVALYLHYGSPGMMNVAAAPSPSVPAANAPLDQLVAQVEQHLEKVRGTVEVGRCWRLSCSSSGATTTLCAPFATR